MMDCKAEESYIPLVLVAIFTSQRYDHCFPIILVKDRTGIDVITALCFLQVQALVSSLESYVTPVKEYASLLRDTFQTCCLHQVCL